MAFIKTRHLRMTSASPLNMTDSAARELASRRGVHDLKFEEEGLGLTIAYDVRFITLKEIEEILQKYGISVVRSRLGQMMASFIHFAEQNERDAAKERPAPCCSHPDEVLRKAHSSHTAVGEVDRRT